MPKSPPQPENKPALPGAEPRWRYPPLPHAPAAGAVVSWSGGKDSTMAAYQLLASRKYEVAALLATVTDQVSRN